MAALDDLTAATAKLASDVTALTTAVNVAVPLLQQIASGAVVSAADAETAVTAIQAALASIESDTANLAGASAPPAAPAQPPSS